MIPNEGVNRKLKSSARIRRCPNRVFFFQGLDDAKGAIVNDKLAVVLASGDPHVLEMGLMYARNAAKQGWMSDVQVFLFGPSETQVATDPALREMAELMISEGLIPVACKYCSDKYSVSDLLEKMGCEIDYVGAPISDAIKAGYVPMVW